MVLKSATNQKLATARSRRSFDAAVQYDASSDQGAAARCGPLQYRPSHGTYFLSARRLAADNRAYTPLAHDIARE
jgi:hypothetical protein